MFVCCGARANSRSLLAIGILFMICFFITISIVTIVVYTSPALVVAALDLNASSIPALNPSNITNRLGAVLIITCLLQLVTILQTLWFRKQVTGNESEEEEYWRKVQKDQASAKAEQHSEKAKKDFEMRARAKAAKSRV
jgi:thiol:disulfide interchange protein